MVKFDATLLRYLDEEDFRVLAAVELASRNHEIAPAMLVEKIAGLKAGGARKRLRWLLKHNFLMHDMKFYDGYRMNYMAYDYLAMRTFVKRGIICGVANKIGVGKESDVYSCTNDDEKEMVMKIHRLGRTSFRSIKKNRDYKNGRALHGESWFYLSRLAATKEFAFMKALYEEGFPTPEPIDQNRHMVIMSRVNGTTLTNVRELEHPHRVFKDCIDLVVKFAKYGLIHGDFNEFNIMLTDDDEVIVIDFPQMTSTNHPNAKMYFDRDVKCIHDFFRRRFKVMTEYKPELHVDTERQTCLDKRLQVTGYNKENEKDPLAALLDTKDGRDGGDADESDYSSSDDDSQADPDFDDAKKASKKKRHVDPTAGATEDADAPKLSKDLLMELAIPQKPREGDDGRHEDDEEEEEEEYDSEKEAERKKALKELKKKKKAMDAASTCSTRRVPKSSLKPRNSMISVSESGVSEINKEVVTNRVKGILKREEMREVYRVCKKNSQKPADKRSTKNDINNARRDVRAMKYDKPGGGGVGCDFTM
eukprot:TRINITY_DN2633_c0_g2_i1.p2 TRINITY_DN2633_c0_g2~~TRINITY_DN2633_c0_g2_i1.p2  ORF type:complete len:534 (+),score=276.35 TRINITY_DN2633_c0_g2_i1:83-1684(+)